MADYIYLLESRLSQAQQRALQAVREIARNKGLTVFLVGGAVRDLTSGSPVRDLDVAVQGNALKLKKDLEKSGATIAGENEPMQALYVYFPGSVRMEVGSTLQVHFPKPGKPLVKAANLLEDLRRRDFTANAMALSLNEGSYGLLMDPLNGVADIENRELRLVSNYGFIEDPVRMIRAVRIGSRLGWQMEEKTKSRYDSSKEEGHISAMSAFQRGYEAEEIVHEEDPLRVMRGLEQEGWMKHLAAGWTAAKANAAELEKLRDAQMQLQLRGIHANPSTTHFPLLTAKMKANDLKALKRSFPRRGFVAEIDAVEGEGKKFAATLGGKQAAVPSTAWKLLMTARPESVLWTAYAVKNASLQAKLKAFYTEWPQARQKIPYVLMQEMRIVPELPGYDELVEKLFFKLMDGKLETPEEMKAFLEPYSPPAPPPPVHLRRPRAAKKDAKVPKSRKKVVGDAGITEGAEGLDATAAAPKQAGADAVKPGQAKVGTPAKAAAPAKAVAPVKAAAVVKAAPAKAPPVKAATKTSAGKAGKAAAKTAAKKPAAKPAAKSVKKAAAKPVVKAKAAAKPAAKSGGKGGHKTSAKAAKKPAAKTAPKKAAVKHPAHKSAKKASKKK